MLIKCPECDHDVSDQTDKCPNCGFPIKKHLKQKAKTYYTRMCFCRSA